MYVVTFYSFKGGVGRTLALLNVAYELADSGQRVLVVDFDLEAPAIRADRWNRDAQDGDVARAGRLSAHPGVVEYVSQYLQTMRVPDVGEFIVDATTPENCQGQIYVMPAGELDDSYGQRLNAIDWNELYQLRDGYVMFEDTRAQWDAAGFDYVMLDSRTGFTDVGGICTRHLPDAVVSLFRPDDQSLNGTRQVVESIRKEGQTPRRRQEIEQHFVMAGIPDADDEHGHLAARRSLFRRRLSIPGPERLLEIRHYPSMDLLTQPIYTQTRKGTRLARSYRDLTGRIRARNIGDREGILDGLRDRRGFAHPRAVDDFLDRVRRRYNDDADVLIELAQTHESRGSILEAAELLDRAAELRPAMTHKQLLHLARARHLTQDRKGALRALRSFFQTDVHHPSEENRELHLVGRAGLPTDTSRLLEGNEASRYEFLQDRELFLLLMEALDLLETLGEDAAPLVAETPIIAGFSPLTRVQVASRLDRSVGERRVAISIIETLLDEDTHSTRQKASWGWPLAFARMAVGDYDRAGRFFRSELDDSASRSDVPTAFNLAMAEWAMAGRPNEDAFRAVVERMDEDDSDWLRDNANGLQGVAVAQWFGNRREQARRSLDLAEKTVGRAQISCWSYTRVPRKTFLKHCAEIRQLFAGEDIRPVFLRGGG